MAKEREHQLFGELRAARLDLAEAVEAEEEARRVVAEKKTIRRKVELLIEEILDEVTTGKRRDSLIEYAEARAADRPEPETADERQRGPTVRTAERADRRLIRESTVLGDPSELARALAPAPGEGPVKADWGTPCHMTVALRLPTGADYVHAKYTPPTVADGVHHLEFKGPVSETGYRSHFFHRPEHWGGDLCSYVDRLARHLVRLNYHDAAEEKDAPIWRSIGLNMVGSPVDPQLAKTLHKGGLRTLGDLADAVDLECAACTTKNGQTVISQPKFAAAAAAIDSYRDKLAADARNAEPVSPPPETADEHQRGPTADPFEFAGDGRADDGGGDMCSLHDGSWRDVKIKDVISGATIRNVFRDSDVVNLGQLADAGVDLGLYAALSSGGWFSKVEIASIEADLAKWVRKYPKGFPAKLVEDLGAALTSKDVDDLADDIEPDVATEDDVMDALHDAIFPDPAPSDWKGWARYRDSGHISDADVLRELGAIWPSRITYFDVGGDSGYTVRGGAAPAFWFGVLPPGKLPVEDLGGANLAIAVRSLLRIPEPAVAPNLPGTAETPPAKAAKSRARKPKTAAVD